MGTHSTRRIGIAALVTSTVTASVVLLGACNETRRSLGEECLKGDDCLSTVCSSQHCVEVSPVLDAAPVAIVQEAASDVVIVPDAADDAPVEDATPIDAARATDAADGE